jgi:hypothetical protein
MYTKKWESQRETQLSMSLVHDVFLKIAATLHQTTSQCSSAVFLAKKNVEFSSRHCQPKHLRNKFIPFT